MRNYNKRTERIGVKGVSNEGYEMECVDYIRHEEITVRLSNGHEVKTNWGAFKKGQVKNPYHKAVVGVGYIGEGRHKSGDKTGKSYRVYRRWRGMLERCYSDTFQQNNPTYEGCTVCEEWHNYQVFADWYQENYYTIDGETIELDKDIIIKGNTVYSPDTCVFVPKRINSLFIKKDENRGALPIGVTSRNNKFTAQVCYKGSNKKLGSFDTPEEAFEAYKQAKEQYIQKLALEYKYKIPTRLFVALMNYKVEITD